MLPNLDQTLNYFHQELINLLCFDKTPSLHTSNDYQFSAVSNDMHSLLGQDSSTDCEIEICHPGDESRRIFVRCHRFILASRCPYFAAMLRSGMQESKMNKIRILPPHENMSFTQSCVDAMIKYLYTGVYEHIDNVDDCARVLALADYWGLVGTEELQIVHAPLIEWCNSITANGRPHP